MPTIHRAAQVAEPGQRVRIRSGEYREKIVPRVGGAGNHHMISYEDLPRVPGSYWVSPDGLTLHVHPYGDRNPNKVLMEVTVQQHLFKPDVTDLGYIRIQGISFMHAGND